MKIKNTREAREIAQRWLDYLKREEQKTVELQRLAKLARTDKAEARRQLRVLDSRAPVVYDCARLADAVAHFLEITDY